MLQRELIQKRDTKQVQQKKIEFKIHVGIEEGRKML